MSSIVPAIQSESRLPHRGADLACITVIAVSDHVACDLDGEAVILHLEKGIYYGLNPVGTAVWNMIQAKTTVADIRDALLAEYDVERSQCEEDLVRLLKELADRGLIQMSYEAGGSPSELSSTPGS